MKAVFGEDDAETYCFGEYQAQDLPRGWPWLSCTGRRRTGTVTRRDYMACLCQIRAGKAFGPPSHLSGPRKCVIASSWDAVKITTFDDHFDRKIVLRESGHVLESRDIVEGLGFTYRWTGNTLICRVMLQILLL
jgi:hypothetical protein